jgi:hypothetical protein
VVLTLALLHAEWAVPRREVKRARIDRPAVEPERQVAAS